VSAAEQPSSRRWVATRAIQSAANGYEDEILVALAILNLRGHAARIESRVYGLKQLHDRPTVAGAVAAPHVGDLPPMPRSVP
jgi:hypothetical protein